MTTKVGDMVAHVQQCVLAHGAQEHLDFYGASPRREEDITDIGIQALAGLSRLRSLNLAAHAGLTAEGLDFLAACRQLTALDLSSARLPGLPWWHAGRSGCPCGRS